ncbi:magnesium transporter NIPA-domain-containing protein [Lentinula edodes]|nr:magnesium transporter NIPA-domain-containing protein [Lentinula edodes]
MTVDDKWIGLALAVSSSMAIGMSSIITKKGLNAAAGEGTYGAAASDNLSYLKNGVWQVHLSRSITESLLLLVANFAAYTFAPPILVTPLGALSVLIGAVLASFLLNEELGHLGRVGCGLSLIGSLIIVLHAPEDKEVETVDEILGYAVQPGFLLYVFTVLVFSMVMIYVVAPRYGKSNPLVFISICSVVGSVSVMSIKGFGIAVKLTFGGKNQFTRPSTYLFAIVSTFCILVQMNYFNKALDAFSVNIVNPMYYVGFSTATIVASLILFQGFNTTDTTNTVSLLCGFVVIFLGVHILNLSRRSNDDAHLSTDAGVLDRPLNFTGRLSLDGWHGIVEGGRPEGGSHRMTHGRQSSLYRSQTSTLFNAFEGEEDTSRHEHVGLHQLREEDESDDDDANELTRLRSVPERQVDPRRSASRSHSNSPQPPNHRSLADVRPSPRQV